MYQNFWKSGFFFFFAIPQNLKEDNGCGKHKAKVYLTSSFTFILVVSFIYYFITYLLIFSYLGISNPYSILFFLYLLYFQFSVYMKWGLTFALSFSYHCIYLFIFYFLYSYVHTIIGSLLLPFPPPPHPLASKQKLFCPYL
jgi:hypothetical protein